MQPPAIWDVLLRNLSREKLKLFPKLAVCQLTPALNFELAQFQFGQANTKHENKTAHLHDRAGAGRPRASRLGADQPDR
jgi:hypothetical protein